MARRRGAEAQLDCELGVPGHVWRVRAAEQPSDDTRLCARLRGWPWHGDGRRPYGELGEAVGLSEAAARQRVNRLRESGLMRIVAVTDPVAVGRGVVATIGLKVSGDIRHAAAHLAAIHEIEYVVVAAGSFDVIAELVCATEEDLLGVLNDELRSIPEVREIEIFMHLRTEKNVFAWGQRLGEE